MFHPPELIVHQVTFTFKENKKSDIGKFVSDNINQTIALKIGENIFTTGRILEPIMGNFAVTVFGRNKKQISQELRQVTDNINIK